MMAFSAHRPAEIPRIALVDFNNDSVTDSLRTMQAMFARYAVLVADGQRDEAQKYVLYGVRLDTSGSLRDVNVPPLGDPALDLGVTPRLVFNVRFERLGVPADIYGVGSSLLSNDKETNTDFTADVVRVKLNGRWIDMAKIGRAPAENPDLEPVG
jgi:nicotinate phosphoribosyltransferase